MGDITGIDYGARHALYRRILIQGRSQKAIARTYRLWNEKVFATTRWTESNEPSSESEEDHAENRRRARDGAQPIDNILAQIADSDSDDRASTPVGTEAPAPSNRKGKGVDRDATFTIENMHISTPPTRPATPSTRPATPVEESGTHDVVNPLYMAYDDLTDILDKTIPRQGPTSQLPIGRTKAVFKRPAIVSARQAQAANSAASVSAAASSSAAPPVASASVSAAAAPAPRRTSNRGKPAAGTSELASEQVAGPSNAAARGRGGKAGKKSRGA